ncbi:MAG: hypothetical protein GY909_04180 [Oligoflexia bacterium]|nr:hypothetical protein [Oligoflexia bacterium]
MKKVIYIEKEKFLRDMIEKYFSSKGLQVFTYDGSEPMDYYIEDIGPDLILWDRQSYLSDLPSQIPCLATSREEEAKEGDLIKPLAPQLVYESVIKILS